MSQDFQLDPTKIIHKMQQQKAELEHRNTMLECLVEQLYGEIAELRSQFDSIAKELDGQAESDPSEDGRRHQSEVERKV